MKNEWTSAVITYISIAMYVPPKTEKQVHRDRAYHGLVLNEEGTVSDYYFSDGRVMHTEGGDLFYLPKQSSYWVKCIESHGCYAINFDSDMRDEPFAVRLKNRAALKKSFQSASDEWRAQSTTRFCEAIRAVYHAISLMQKERERKYMPHSRYSLIAPAVEAIERDFTSPELTVERLAELSGMSEVYFRKIFLHSFGTSPKEYIIQKRMEYARELIRLGEFGISHIAELSGYSEPCHFSREYKKRFGVAPKKELAPKPPIK